MVATYEGKETIEGKTVLITGANTGIGKVTATELAKRGGRIIIACRNMEKGEKARQEIIEETNNEDVVLHELDLASFESIQKFAKIFNETEPRLDILINNAGIMSCPKMLTKDGLEMQTGTNHFGHFLLTNLLLDKLKACSPSRIINVSSKAHYHGTINFDDLNSEKSYSAWGAYFQSKLANILHALELSKRLKGTGVTVNSLHPGVVDTDLWQHANKGCQRMLFGACCRGLCFTNRENGAQTTLRLALDPKLEEVSAKYFHDCKEKRPKADARDEEIARRLWEMTEEIIQQKLTLCNQ